MAVDLLLDALTLEEASAFLNLPDFRIGLAVILGQLRCGVIARDWRGTAVPERPDIPLGPNGHVWRSPGIEAIFNNDRKDWAVRYSLDGTDVQYLIRTAWAGHFWYLEHGEAYRLFMMEGDGIDVRFLKPEDGVFLHTHQPDRYPDPDFVFFVDRDQPNRRVTRRDLIFLRRDVDRIKAAPADKPLDPRERATWARIVRVLAAEADLDLKQHTKAAGVLATMATQRGLALDGRLDTTISDKLKLARDIDK